jgi:hypothetical protein
MDRQAKALAWRFGKAERHPRPFANPLSDAWQPGMQTLRASFDERQHLR